MTQPTQSTEMREFMMAVRNALLIVLRYIEKRYMDTRTTTQPVGFEAKSSTQSE